VSNQSLSDEEYSVALNELFGPRLRELEIRQEEEQKEFIKTWEENTNDRRRGRTKETNTIEEHNHGK
jgi:hypothetical protein